MRNFMDSLFFEKNLKQFIGLYAYALHNKNLDKNIHRSELRNVFTDGLKLKTPTHSCLQILSKTISENYGGFAKLRSTQLWKLHLHLALAIYYNR